MEYGGRNNTNWLFNCMAAIIDISIIYGTFFEFIKRWPNFSADFNAGQHLSALFVVINLLLCILIFFYNFNASNKSLSMFMPYIVISALVFDIAIVFFSFIESFVMSNCMMMFCIYAVQIILLLIWKSIYFRIWIGIGRPKSVLVIGTESDIDMALAALSRNTKQSVNAICMKENMNDVAKRFINSAEDIYLCSSLSYEQKDYITNLCIGTNKTVFVIPRIYDISLAMSSIQHIDDLLVLKIVQFSLSKGKERVKRIFDISTAMLAIIITLPLMLCVAAVIKLYDGGTALYWQERLTKGGMSFMLYKFRTMANDAEKHTGPILAVENDNRITPVGRILRNTRIDELPQLFNVIKGDMSMVGPRPERPHFEAQFLESIPEFRFRLAVKAGVTGLAQVNGKYSTSPENKLRFDMFYIRNYSVGLDIKILFKTIGVLFKKEYSVGISKGIETGGVLNPYADRVQIL